MRTRRNRVVPRRTYRPRVLIIGRKWAKRHPMAFSDVSGHRPDDIIMDDTTEPTLSPDEQRRLTEALSAAYERVKARGWAPALVMSRLEE